ncbi:MAG: hypothetical protein ABI920_09225, partial [Casimicrobiaceae bacterium]
FGFALFYLRSVAPAKVYLDRLTGRSMQPVTTGQIYWGAVPFVLIQLVMVSLVIAFPQMVMVYKAKDSKVDPSKVMIELPTDTYNAPGLPRAFQIPNAAPADGTPGAPVAPSADPLQQQLDAQPSDGDANKALEDQLKAPAK